MKEIVVSRNEKNCGRNGTDSGRNVGWNAGNGSAVSGRNKRTVIRREKLV